MPVGSVSVPSGLSPCCLETLRWRECRTSGAAQATFEIGAWYQRPPDRLPLAVIEADDMLGFGEEQPA